MTVNKAAPRGSRPERPPRVYESAYRIYVGNLPWDVDDARLEQVFSEHGKVVNARVVYDRESGRSRGFGFVTMSTETELNDAIAALDGRVRSSLLFIEGSYSRTWAFFIILHVEKQIATQIYVWQLLFSCYQHPLVWSCILGIQKRNGCNFLLMGYLLVQGLFMLYDFYLIMSVCLVFQSLEGRAIRVNVAEDRPRRNFF